MKLGEYRRSLDLDFLCADASGYRELRTRASELGVRAFFAQMDPVVATDAISALTNEAVRIWPEADDR